MHWVHESIGYVQQTYHCIDAFGASGRVKDTWLRAGFQAIGFDIKLSPDHDLTSETGFKALVQMGLEPLHFECESDSSPILDHFGLFPASCFLDDKVII